MASTALLQAVQHIKGLYPDTGAGWLDAKTSCVHELLQLMVACLLQAMQHRHELYPDTNPAWLDWSWRRNRILDEITHWLPDIACFQEMEDVQHFVEGLDMHG